MLDLNLLIELSIGAITSALATIAGNYVIKALEKAKYNNEKCKCGGTWVKSKKIDIRSFWRNDINFSAIRMAKKSPYLARS
jgi:hypothetical protein